MFRSISKDVLKPYDIRISTNIANVMIKLIKLRR